MKVSNGLATRDVDAGLFDWADTQSRRASMADQFAEFHARNPHVYARLVELAKNAKARGHRFLSIDMLFGVVRYDHALRTDVDPAEPFKLNNNYRAFYARKIMVEVPELAGFFEVRVSQADQRQGGEL